MGRQVEFYFDDGDEREFLKLSQFEDVVFLRFRELTSAQCEVCHDMEQKARNETSCNQTCICLKHDIQNVKFQGTPGNFFVDLHDSPLIEFTRSGYRSELNRIISGRLWYEHKYWAKDENGADVLLEKSEDLKKLYDTLARWIKKYCKRLPNGKYIGPHAAVLLEKGAKLSP